MKSLEERLVEALMGAGITRKEAETCILPQSREAALLEEKSRLLDLVKKHNRRFATIRAWAKEFGHASIEDLCTSLIIESARVLGESTAGTDGGEGGK